MRKIFMLLFAMVLFAGAKVNAQITYTWAAPGTSGDFQVAASWNPVGVPASGDNIIVNPSASITISNVPAGITLNNVTVTPTVTSTLTLTAAAASVLSVSGTMTVTGTAVITGTVAIGTNVTLAVTGTGNVRMNTGSAFFGSTITNFTFASGAVLNYALDGGTIPTAGYNANSTVNVTGVVSSSPTPPSSVGNFIWNCPNQTIAANLLSTLTTITGTATISNTGPSGTFQWGSAPIVTITGVYTINGPAILASAGGTITCNGGLVLNSGGTMSGTGTTTYNIGTGANLSLNTGGVVTGASTQTFIMAGIGAQAATFNSNISGLVNFTVNATSVTTLGSSALLNNLTVLGGGSLATSVGQTITVNSVATLGTTATNGTVSGGGNLAVTANGSLSIAGTGAAILSGGTALGISGTVSVLSGNITLNGTAAQTFGANFPTPMTIGTVTISNAAGVTVDKTVSINAFTITAGVTTISGGITLTVNGSATLANTAGILAVAGTYTQAAGTITFGATATATGAGTFNLNSGATLSTANTAGISASGATGSVQTTTRNFNANANYTFTGGATGTGMPATVSGTVTITTAATIGAAYTFTGTFTSTASLTITSPNSITIGATGIANHSTSTTVTGSGSYITLSGATLNIATASASAGNGLFPPAASGSGLFQPTTLTISTGTNVIYTGSTALVPTGTRCPATLATIGISGTGSLSLTAALSVTNLSFTNTGLINTTVPLLLTVTGTAANSVVRTTTSTTGGFVAGPLARTFPLSYNSGNTFLYPIGKSTTYQGFEMVNPVTGAGGSYTIQMESFLTAPTGGSAGTGLSGSLAAFYWQATVSGAGSLTSVSSIRVTNSAILATQKIGQSATVGGAYNSIGGTFTPGASLLSGLPVGTFAGGTFFGVATGASSGTFAAGTYSVGPSGSYGGGYAANYFSITAALAAMAENASLGGSVILELQTDYSSSVESYPLNFTASVPTTPVNTVTIRPVAGVASAISFNPAGGNATGIFDFNGGKNFIIDGRNGGTGTNQFLSINNLGNGPAVRFINDGQNNIFRYVLFTAANTSTTSGVVLFSNTTGSLAANGNSNNTIDNCNVNANGISPNGIFASGSLSPADNKSNIITNNKVYDFYQSGSVCSGINLQAGNTTWTIGTIGNGNSVYQTSTRVPAATTIFRAIFISNTFGNGFTINGNTIGGNITGIAGSVMILGSSTQTNTIANVINGIRADVGATTVTNIQGNTIANITLISSATSSSSIYFAGIFASAGLVNIGDVAGNIIGSNTSTGSINFSFRGTGTGAGSAIGIIAGNGSAYVGGSVNNNTVGGFTTNADFALTGSIGFTGIQLNSTGLTVATSVNNNTIGNLTTPNSIQHLAAAQMPSFQTGISFAATSLAVGGATVQGNSIANITNSTTWAYNNNVMQGINISGTAVTAGPLTVSGNTVRNITTSSNCPTILGSTSILGLNVSSNVSGNALFTISNNTFHTLINNTTIATPLAVTGMLFNASNTGGNIVERNYFHSFSTDNNNTAASQYGIAIAASAGANSTFRNNMIRLGNNPDGSSNTASTLLNGIYKINTNATNIFFNSIYIGGSGVASGSVNTAALYKISTSGADDIRNNIFYNARSNSTGSGKHYAININTTTSLTVDYNDLFVAGTGGNIGTNGTSDFVTHAAFKAGTGLSANGVSGDPQFLVPAGTSALGDLHISPINPTQIESGGIAIGSVTNDFDNDTRASFTPTDIGADAGNFTVLDVTAPSITYTVLGITSCTTNRTLTSFATITDGSGVNTTLGTRPRIYYKKASDVNNTFNDNTSGTAGWKFAEATNAASPFDFTIDYSLLFGGVPVTGDVIQYFVVAQDLVGTPNVGINSGTFTAMPSSVALTAAAFPIGGTINSYTLTPVGLSGIVNVGTAQTFKSLTEVGTATGIFANINANGLTGNTTVVLTDASITETGATALNAIASSGCSGGPYTLTIKPNAGTTTTLTGSVATGAIIKLNGADNVTIDGSNNGTATKDLTITNTNTATSGNAVIWMASASASDGATNNIIKNTIITGNAATTTQMGIFSGGTASISTFGNSLTPNAGNTYQNNTVSKSQYGIFVIGVGTGTLGTGLTITGNNLGSSTVGDGFQNEGIDIQFQNGAVISGNDVQNIVSNAATSLQGINIVNSKSSTISANKIHFMSYTGASTTKVYGITTSTSTFNLVGNQSVNGYYNNIVYDLISTATSASWNTSGINNNGGYNDKYYYNSVYLTGQMSGTGGTAGSAAFSNGNGITSANCPVIDIQNNAFYMKGSSLAAAPLYAHFTTVTTYSGSTINYNDLISAATGSATAQLGRFNGIDYATLALWQPATSKDANSISVDPLFNSNTNLQPQLGSPLVNAGTPVSVTTDIVGVPRSGTTPTIGAYEQAADLAAPTIVYTPLGVTCATTSRVLTATITDPSGVPTAGVGLPVLYFKVNAGPYTAVQGVSIGSNQYTFTFGSGTSANDVVSYYVVAQDNAATPNVGSNPSTGASGFTANPPAASTPPTTPNTYTIGATLNGTYTVGAGGSYTTLTAAVAAYNTACLGGPVVFSLTDASYASETFPITINANTGSSATNTLTIKSTQAPTTMSGSSASALIVLNGADYVTIDGSTLATANTICPASAASRDLTLTNINTGTSSAVIWMQTTAGADAATNNTIRNLNIVGNSNTQTLFGVGAGSSTISLSSLGTGNINNSYINNNISATQYGIYTQGASAANKNTGTVINQNLINTASPNNVARGGIIVGFADNITISGNNISGIAMAGIPDVFGITLGMGTSVSATTSAGNEVTNATVSNNVIGSVVNNGTYSAVGIAVAAATSGTTLLSNNMISGVASNGTGGDFGAGIILGGGTGSTTNVYYNTVSMQGTITGATAASQTSACLAVTNSTQPTIDLRDNIFSNSQLGNASATLRFAAIALAYSTFTTLTSNYNDLYSAGAGPGTYTVGITGTVVGGTNSVTLANWQLTTGKDANSVNVLPSFVSATDLHLTNSGNASLLAAGTAVTVTTDIDCANRGGNPDIGADQVSIAVVAVGVEYFRGTKQGTANFLDWKVNCSSDPSVRLILERSADGRNFKSIQDQNVTAARCAQGFSYTDAAPLAGINYYRLKTISPDGAFRYSVIVALINKDKGFELISVAPNPVKTNTVLYISTVKAGKMSIAVSDMTGKVVMTQNINVIAGNNPITMNFATLGAGTYNIKVINAENEVKVTRFVKY